MLFLSRTMRDPPKITDVQGKVVPVEVLPPESASRVRISPT